MKRSNQIKCLCTKTGPVPVVFALWQATQKFSFATEHWRALLHCLNLAQEISSTKTTLYYYFLSKYLPSYVNFSPYCLQTNDCGSLKYTMPSVHITSNQFFYNIPYFWTCQYFWWFTISLASVAYIVLKAFCC